MQRWPAAWRRRSATLLSTPPLTSTATRNGARLAAAHRVRCSSTSTASPAPAALGAGVAGGAEDDSAQNARCGRRERVRGLGFSRGWRRRSGQRAGRVETTTRSMGGARRDLSAAAERFVRWWIGSGFGSGKEKTESVLSGDSQSSSSNLEDDFTFFFHANTHRN